MRQWQLQRSAASQLREGELAAMTQLRLAHGVKAAETDLPIEGHEAPV